MATLLFANNIQTTLATSITSSQTSVTLTSTAGLPSPSAGQYFVMTFTSGNTNEIVWVTNVTGSTITCIRAKEGTSGTSFASGSYASCFPTAGTQQDFVQIDQLQNGAYTFTNGAGTANALTATIASNLTATSLPNGFQFILNAANANTGAATLNLTLNPTLPGSGATTSTGALPIYRNGTIALTGGEITGANYLCLMTYNANYNGGAGAFVLENPYNPVTGVVGITQVQDEYFTYNTSGGSSDAITLTVPAGLTSLVDGAIVTFRNTTSANTTTTPTLNVTYGSTATGATVIKKYANAPLSAGDTGGVGYVCQLVYSSSASAWMLLNPAPGVAGGVTSITGSTGITASSPSGAVTLTNTGVLTVNGSAGTVTVSPTSISALSLVSTTDQYVASHVYFAQNIYPYAVVCTGTGVVFPAFQVTYEGYTGFLTPTSLQLGINGTGLFVTTGTNLSMQVGGITAISIDGSQNASVYGSLTTGQNIYCDNQAYKPGGGSWSVLSDVRLKNNISPLNNALTVINSLNPVNYDWNYKNSEPTVGFIAQEVQKILPNSITFIEPSEDQKPFIKDGKLLSLGFQNDIFAYLVGAIKELNTLVQTQADQIAALNKKVKL
jgi:hypothetical protein